MRFEVEAMRATVEDRARRRPRADVVGDHALAPGGAIDPRVAAPAHRSTEGHLMAAVHWLARQYRNLPGEACVASVSLPEEPDADAGLVVFRVVQEALDGTRLDVSAGTLRPSGDAGVATFRARCPRRGRSSLRARHLIRRPTAAASRRLSRARARHGLVRMRVPRAGPRALGGALDRSSR
ncbi:MAG: hypothetical protein R3A52_15095 [Polyangiales bacterium]